MSDTERTPAQARRELAQARVATIGGTGKNKSKGHRHVGKPNAGARRFNKKGAPR